MDNLDRINKVFENNDECCKLTIRQSVTTEIVIGLLFSLAIIINIYMYFEDQLSGGLGWIVDSVDELIFNPHVIAIFLLPVVVFLCGAFFLACIMYFINSVSSTIEVTFEKIFSVVTYGYKFSALFIIFAILTVSSSLKLSGMLLLLAFFIFIILIYEGYRKLLAVGKSKLIYSLSIAIIFDYILMYYITYNSITFIIEDLFNSFTRSIFGF